MGGGNTKGDYRAEVEIRCPDFGWTFPGFGHNDHNNN